MLPSNTLQEFVRIVGREHVLTSPEDLVAYSYDGTSVEHRPDAVVSPLNTEQESDQERDYLRSQKSFRRL